VRLIWTEGSGCYGQNGSDDVSGDAALLSQLVGKPVRVQWMRRQEHQWEPKGAAMAMSVKGGLDTDGKIVAWDYAVWSPNHALRPYYDMAGNVFELGNVNTWSYGYLPVWGGGANSAASDARAAARRAATYFYGDLSRVLLFEYGDLGFRLVRTVPPQNYTAPVY
jgi:hypothetical protein